MLGNSWVAAQLAASPEGFNCMELSVYLIQVVLEHSSKDLIWPLKYVLNVTGTET
jgi:hypothetical protein